MLVYALAFVKIVAIIASVALRILTCRHYWLQRLALRCWTVKYIAGIVDKSITLRVRILGWHISILVVAVHPVVVVLLPSFLNLVQATRSAVVIVYVWWACVLILCLNGVLVVVNIFVKDGLGFSWCWVIGFLLTYLKPGALKWREQILVVGVIEHRIWLLGATSVIRRYQGLGCHTSQHRLLSIEIEWLNFLLRHLLHDCKVTLVHITSFGQEVFLQREHQGWNSWRVTIWLSKDSSIDFYWEVKMLSWADDALRCLLEDIVWSNSC